ncbi:MAG: cell envelope integrity protein CreD, partial [Shimia sp.]
MRSQGLRFIVVGVLALLMFIPLFFTGAIVDDRARYAEQTARDIAREWGGAQVLSGPQLVIPITETIREEVRENLIDAATGLPERDPNSGAVLYRVDIVEREAQRGALYLLPEVFDVTLSTTSDIRKRGIFEVPVYRADAGIDFSYDLSLVEARLSERQTAVWEDAEVVFALSSNRALRGPAELTADGEALKLDPWTGEGERGIAAAVPRIEGDPAFRLDLAFQGAESLQIAPVGRVTQVAMSSDWAHPSFNGAFLPDTSDITEVGFKAQWTIPHLARAVPEVSTGSLLAAAGRESFGLRYFQPNDFYQKAFRAARYGILFIALTFLAVLLMEPKAARPVHPVQYILIGLAQSMFVVLMVAYAEQIGFGLAYALAAGAVAALITAYGWTGLKLGRRALVLGAVLVTLYALL